MMEQEAASTTSRRVSLWGMPRQIGGAQRGLLRFVRRKPLGAAGLAVVLFWVVLAVVAPLATPGHDPYIQDYTVDLEAPGAANWLGTDRFGRDLYTRVVYGSRISLVIAFTAVGIGGTLGLLAGIASGYIGRWVDGLLMRLVDILLAFPGLLLALALIAVLGAGVDRIIIALTVISAPWMMRVIRAQTLSTKQNLYIEAARAVGASSGRIMVRHILPNVLPPYLIIATSLLGFFILMEATLSFLGLGVPPPDPSWGRMLSGSAQERAQTAPWLVVFPGIAITTLVMGFNLLGDALRDLWDPRLRSGPTG